MAYIVGLVILGLFFIALHYFTDLDNTKKASIAGITFAIIAGATLYNRIGDIERENMMHVVIKFNQNKTVKCDGIDVNNSNYTLSTGTFTFIGKKDTPNYGQMISASECQ